MRATTTKPPAPFTRNLPPCSPQWTVHRGRSEWNFTVVEAGRARLRDLFQRRVLDAGVGTLRGRSLGRLLYRLRRRLASPLETVRHRERADLDRALATLGHPPV